MRISSGVEEHGIVVGNTYNKYQTQNIIARHLMSGFERALTGLVEQANPAAIHEIGCGEGYWVCKWIRQGLDARGSDFSDHAINLARENAREQQIDPNMFQQRSIYDLLPDTDQADLLVCCEVLEHLYDPIKGLEVLQGLVTQNIILSVPREPIWRVLNMMRGKYLSDLGNTPGHVQHWSSSQFLRLIGSYFEIKEVRTPFPWTMALCGNKS